MWLIDREDNTGFLEEREWQRRGRRRTGIHIVVLLLSANVALATETRGALDKGQLSSIYREKYVHLLSSQFEYAERCRNFDVATGKVSSDHAVVRTFEIKNGKVYQKELLLDQDTGSQRINLVSVFDGESGRTLLPPDDSVSPPRGFIDAASPTTAMSTLGVHPLGYAMLFPMSRDSENEGSSSFGNTDFSILLTLDGVSVRIERDGISNRDLAVIEWSGAAGVHSRIWIDPSLNFSVVKRESYASTQQGRMYTRFQIEFSDFQEVVPGLFVPANGRMIDFWEDGSRIDEKEWTNIKLKPNAAIDDAVFSLNFPKGTIVQDNATGQKYVHPVEGINPDRIDIKSLGEEAAASLFELTSADSVKHAQVLPNGTATPSASKVSQSTIVASKTICMSAASGFVLLSAVSALLYVRIRRNRTK